MQVTRADVLRYRVHAQQLDRTGEHDDAAILDIGVQDTGPDGVGWALEVRGARVPEADLLYAWTLRGAPHAYRRAEAAKVATAVSPYSEADAVKRVFDASSPLTKAGIPVLDALDVIATEMRDVVRTPTTKGDLSTALTERLPEPYLRWCRVCGATHAYEQTFRLSAIRAGLELEPHTSPPVLRRIPRWRRPAATAPARLDPVRAAVHFLGPTTPKLVAGYVDSPVKEISAQWPDDTVAVSVDGQELQILADDAEALAGAEPVAGVRLLGPFDVFLQGRDRELVLPDETARKDLWRTLGRPGGILHGHEVVGSWRPRSSGKRLRIAVTTYTRRPPSKALTAAAEQLAAFRGRTFEGFADE